MVLRGSFQLILSFVFMMMVSLSPAHANDLERKVAALIAVYPEHLSHQDGNELVWLDGTRMMIDDGVIRSHQDMLMAGDIEDMLSQRYPIGRCSYGAPANNVDPGRIRNEPFFRKMYGDSSAAVRNQLTSVHWLPNIADMRLPVTTVNRVDQALQAVSDELMSTASSYRDFLQASGGTFNWRVIAGTDRLSVHSFGAAIDINPAVASYWRWRDQGDGVVSYHNNIPIAIVEVFERHGFIWGGKWYHYDTMHFEYRPELLALAEVQDAGC